VSTEKADVLANVLDASEGLLDAYFKIGKSSRLEAKASQILTGAYNNGPWPSVELSARVEEAWPTPAWELDEG
jgi:hypothetical protein